MEPVSRLVQLANTVRASAMRIQELLDAYGAPVPSFDVDSPPFPPAINDARSVLLDATAELNDLLRDPLDILHQNSRGDGTACLQTIARFGVASMVPPRGRTSIVEIASKVPLTEQMTGRLIRHAVTRRIFCEPEPGQIAHTHASFMLGHPEIRDWLLAGTEELGPASVRMADALTKWPAAAHPHETAFSLVNDSSSIYEAIAQDSARASRFANAMKVMTSKPEFHVRYGTDSYNWSLLGATNVVDVGGAQGHFAFALAKRYPALRIVVQDMPAVVEGANSTNPVPERVHFMSHSMFDPQPVRAKAYIYRWVLHNWSDQYCLSILRALVPALVAGVRIIVQEMLLLEPGAVGPEWKERELRSMDIEMAYTFNGRERTLSDLKALFTEADVRFIYRQAIHPKGSALSIVEFIWKGGSIASEK